MTTLTVTVSREGDDLQIGPSPASGLWVETLSRANWQWRRSYATSRFHDSSTLDAATKDKAQRVMVMYAQAASIDALDDLCDEVEEAFHQWFFTLTVTEGAGSPKAWECDVSDVEWSEHDSGMADAFMARATVTIPCYPVPS